MEEEAVEVVEDKAHDLHKPIWYDLVEATTNQHKTIQGGILPRSRARKKMEPPPISLHRLKATLAGKSTDYYPALERIARATTHGKTLCACD